MLATVALALAPLPPGRVRPASAADLDGVALPDTWSAGGIALRLNGIGLRTYSLFRVHIYVAALYLQQPSRDADAILHSDGVKLLVVRFLHDVNAQRAREAWLNGLHNSCQPPCRLAEPILRRFLAGVPDFHRGDASTLLFTVQTVAISVNGQPVGTIDDPQFSHAMLSNFIGAHPPSEAFKHGLLGLPQ